MASATGVLAAAARTAVAAVGGLNGVFDGQPVKGSPPYAVIEMGPESDWGWKGGEGREIRLGATLFDAGERPGRLRGLMAAVEAALIGLGDVAEGWRIVNVVLVRARTAQKRAGDWSGVVEVKARMERVG